MRTYSADERAELARRAKQAAEQARTFLQKPPAQADMFASPALQAELRIFETAVTLLAKAVADLSDALLATDEELQALKAGQQATADHVHVLVSRSPRGR
jgi:hypothetical protein